MMLNLIDIRSMYYKNCKKNVTCPLVFLSFFQTNVTFHVSKFLPRKESRCTIRRDSRIDFVAVNKCLHQNTRITDFNQVNSQAKIEKVWRLISQSTTALG